MEKINRHNYEAYFLDFAEGNLSALEIDELNVFLTDNPELKTELEAFEIIELSTTLPQIETWSGLKKPTLETLRDDAAMRDAFYLRAIEKQLTPLETKMLNTLLKEDIFKKEYSLWQKVILLAGNEQVQKDSLYQFGLGRAISNFNYDYFLVARCEGLLSDAQNNALENFAKQRPNGVRELQIADSLKLKPAQGIFYSDKKALYKKEKSALVFWLYRAAAIAAVLLLGVFIWNQYRPSFPERAAITKNENQDNVKPVPSDSVMEKKVAIPDTVETIENDPALQEWEVREPDFVEYAESKTTEPKTSNKSGEETEAIFEKEELVEVENMTAEIETRILKKDTIIDIKPIEKMEPEDNLANANPNNQAQPVFKTIPELAGDMLAQKLSVPDSEKDEMALILAKRATTKAGEFLNAEYKKESSEEDEFLTYSLRVGSFKISRTRSK